MATKARYERRTRLDGGFGVWDLDKSRWVNRVRYETKGAADDAVAVLETIRMRGGGRREK